MNRTMAAYRTIMAILANHVEPIHRVDESFFLGLEGHQVTCNAIRQTSHRQEKRPGIQRLRAHLLGHTFAVSYLVNGDLFTLQQVLRRATGDGGRYVNFANTQVMTQHKRFALVGAMNLRQVNRAVTEDKGVGNYTVSTNLRAGLATICKFS